MSDSFAQFQLRTLFIATAVCGVVLWALFVKPHWAGLSAIYMVYCLVPAATVAGIVFHRGYWQAFFIGMAPWVIAMLFVELLPKPQRMGMYNPPIYFDPFLLDYFAGTDQTLFRKLGLVAALLIAAASGLVAVGVRWWAISLQKRNN